jgi:hypothetical protein
VKRGIHIHFCLCRFFKLIYYNGLCIHTYLFSWECKRNQELRSIPGFGLFSFVRIIVIVVIVWRVIGTWRRGTVRVHGAPFPGVRINITLSAIIIIAITVRGCSMVGLDIGPIVSRIPSDIPARLRKKVCCENQKKTENGKDK